MGALEPLVLFAAVAALWAGAIGIIVLIFHAVGVADRLARAADRALAPELPPTGADVRDIQTGRPHLRLVVDHVGADVERDVFTDGDAA